MLLEDPEYLTELFSGFGRVSARRMFGGTGVFHGGLMIGLVAGGELFLKADNETIPSFEAEHMKPFSYGTGKKRVAMSYWRLPDRLLDDPDEMAVWARKAFGAAQRAAAEAPKRPAKKKRR